jgi:hypothetical protein
VQECTFFARVYIQEYCQIRAAKICFYKNIALFHPKSSTSPSTNTKRQTSYTWQETGNWQSYVSMKEMLTKSQYGGLVVLDQYEPKWDAQLFIQILSGRKAHLK